MPSSFSRGAPFPIGADPATVATWIDDLAEWVNDRPGISVMTSGSRAALSGVELWEGRYVHEEDTGILQARRSGAWIALIDADTFTQQIVPVGAIFQFGGSSAPTGYLLCDGTAVSRTTYADLFALYGITYGAGNGSTTFNLPNFKGRVPAGFDAGNTKFDVLGEVGGAETVALITAELPAHLHAVGTLATSSAGTHNHGGSTAAENGGGVFAQSINGSPQNTGVNQHGSHAHGISSDGAHTHTVTGSTANTGSGTAHNNLSPYLTVNYIVKH